jgi:hypothetical protein
VRLDAVTDEEVVPLRCDDVGDGVERRRLLLARAPDPVSRSRTTPAALEAITQPGAQSRVAVCEATGLA